MKKFEAIESLRGWMAWWVVVGHALILTGAGSLLPPSLRFYLLNGSWAVATFMIVSGFVITHLLIIKQEDYLPYLIRRFFRLFPLFLVLMTVSILVRDIAQIGYTNAYSQDIPMRIERYQLENTHWMAHLFLHLTMIHGMIPDTVLKYASSTYLSPAWSLSLEWQFYMLAPIVLPMLSRFRRGNICAIVLMITLIAISLSGWIGQWRYQSFLPIAMPFFLVGITSRLWFEKGFPYLASIATIASLLVYCTAAGPIPPKGLVIILTIWVFFLLLTAREHGLLQFKAPMLDRLSWLVAHNPLIVALGRISYSTYLVHMPIFSAIIGAGMLVSGKSDQTIVIILAMACVPIIAATSFLLYHYVEQPGVHLGKIAADGAARRGLVARL
jgi:peptidoglycan/LPS O-acetylase OafA/YrhL